jgi:hypothetical protein
VLDLPGVAPARRVAVLEPVDTRGDVGRYVLDVPSIWNRINLVNPGENILPTRLRADLILKNGESHEDGRGRCLPNIFHLADQRPGCVSSSWCSVVGSDKSVKEAKALLDELAVGGGGNEFSYTT